MRTIAIINQKGGCGKTTTAINLSAMLARTGKRTLLVDLDSQSHCAAGLGIPEAKIEMDIGDAMLAAGNKDIDLNRLLWQPATNLELAPSRMRLAGLEASRGGLANLTDKERRLALAIDAIASDYDLVCIDCAPSIGLLTYNALVAADVILVPVETSFFSLQGATRQVNTVRSLSRKLGINRQTWILPTIHDASNQVAEDLLSELHRRFTERVIPVVIRRDVKLREAASFGQSIIDYAPNSSAAEDYGKLADWVIRHWTVAGEVEAALAESLALDDPTEPCNLSDASEQSENGEDSYQTEPAEVDEQGNPIAPAEAELVIPLRPQPSRVGQFARASAVENKPASRAEEVARRAQEFARRASQVRASEVTQSEAPRAEIRTPEPRPFTRPVHAAARRLLGVREINQGTLFVQPANCGRNVSIAGTFNNWEGTPMMRNDELGVFELCLPTTPGKHYYRLVIDG
jgi:chromosome partitioning protein